MVERGLVREFLIEHELGRILRIEVQFIDQAPRFLVRGSNHRVQLCSEFFFMTRCCLEVNVEDYRGVCHIFRNELWGS